VPGGGSVGGFWAVVGAMVVLTLGLLVFFRRRRWL